MLASLSNSRYQLIKSMLRPINTIHCFPTPVNSYSVSVCKWWKQNTKQLCYFFPRMLVRSTIKLALKYSCNKLFVIKFDRLLHLKTSHCQVFKYELQQGAVCGSLPLFNDFPWQTISNHLCTSNVLLLPTVSSVINEMIYSDMDTVATALICRHISKFLSVPLCI